MKFRLDYEDCNIKLASLMVLTYFQSEDFLKIVRGVEQFNHSDHSGVDVARVIKEFTGTVVVKSYRSWWPWSKAIAYAKNGTVYFNTRKNAPVHQRANTLVHETLHVMGYSHKGNKKTSYNLKTVPYLVGRLFQEFVEDKRAR